MAISVGAVAPFRLQSAPADVFPHASWLRAQEAALHALGSGQSVLVLGPPGVGKTLFLQSLETILRAQGRRVRALGHGENPATGLLTDVLLVDEAEHLGSGELAAVFARPGPFVAAALPESGRNRFACSRPLATMVLEPVSPQEVARFVVTRLRASGSPRDVFTAEAVLALARCSGGLLRLVNMLAGSALFLAEQEGARQVDASHVEEAAAIRDGLIEEPAPASPVPARTRRPRPAAGRRKAPRRRRGAVPFWAAASVAMAVLATLPATYLARHGAGPSTSAERSDTGPMLAMPVPARTTGPESAVTPSVEAAQIPAATMIQVAQTASAEPSAPDVATPAEAEPARALPTLRPVAAKLEATPSSPTLALANAEPPPASAGSFAPEQPLKVLAFSGPIMNDTINQGGRLSLELRTEEGAGPVGAWFHAFAGLIGTGSLFGHLGSDGRVILKGRLMMGNNPFQCTLEARLVGDRLVGEAVFVRAGKGSTAHSSFTLYRS